MFYNRYKLSFTAYLSITALISGLHKMVPTLDLICGRLEGFKNLVPHATEKTCCV